MEWGWWNDWNGVPSKTTPVWEKCKGMDWSSQGPWVLRFRCVIWWHTPFWDNLLNQMDRYYIWAPAKILYIWVVDIYGYRFPGFCGNQQIRDPTWSQNPFLNRLENGSSSCFVGFRCFGNTSCSFRVAFIWMHVPSCSFHLHASHFYCAFISFRCPFMFLSLVFMFHSYSFHVPFMFIPMCIHVLSLSFLKLWKWLHSLAEASAT